MPRPDYDNPSIAIHARSRQRWLSSVSLGLISSLVKATSPHRVRVIVDPIFGERLAALPVGEAVWIIDTPENSPVAHRLWKERPR